MRSSPALTGETAAIIRMVEEAQGSKLPIQAVVDKIMELNGMNNSALSVGQSLLTPVYAR